MTHYRDPLLFLAFFLLAAVLPVAPAQRAWGRTPDPITQSESKAEEEVRVLEPGRRIRRELAARQKHIYQIRLNADQFLRAIVEQQGIDVAIRVLDPKGEQIFEFDSEARLQGPEEVSLTAAQAGEYRLIVQSKYRGVPSAGYEIRIEELRDASDRDRALQEARRLYGEAVRARGAGRADEAIAELEHALEIRKRLLGPDHREVAAVINSLAQIYRDKGEYAKAEMFHEQALSILEKALGPDHREVAGSLNDLALVYNVKGEYEQAESLYQRALALFEKTLGPEHPSLASTLNNLANLQAERGGYDQAQSLYLRALAIREKFLGPEHTLVAQTLNDLAVLYRDRGEYEKAELLYQRSLAIFEKTFGPGHPAVANLLNNLAGLSNTKGDFAKAEPLFQRALAIWEKALGPENTYFAGGLHNLGTVYYERGDFEKAESHYQRALAIWEKALGREHPNVALSLNGLANTYRARGDFEQAEQFHRRALAIREKALGPDHPDVAESLNNLAYLYRTRGEYAKAEPLGRRAVEIREKGQGPQHPDVGVSLNTLAGIYAAKGDLVQAIALQSRANAISEHNLALNLASGSERQKLAYLALTASQIDFTLSLHNQYAPDNPQALDLAFTTLLRRKGRGLDAMTDSIAALRRHSTPEVQKLFDQLAEARSQLAALTFRESATAAADSYGTQIKPLEEKVENLEADLSARSLEFRAQSQPATLAAVQEALPKGSALIEFTLFRPRDLSTDKPRPPRYLAYLLPAQGQPNWVDLGEAEPIDRIIAEWRKALRGRPDVNELGRKLDEKLMRPLRSLLGDTRQLLIAPDGSLNLIPFAALVDEHHQYLLAGYTISYLTSGRDLLHLQRSGSSLNPPLVMANPAFGRAPAAHTRAHGEAPPFTFNPLPRTEGEALAIKGLMPEASLLLRDEATEAALKQVRSPRFLHIATHGFFLSDQEPAPETFLDDPLRLSDLRLGKWTAQIKDPLLRSGLALSGANQSQGEGEDGVLTALEAASLDLYGTKLVVLSACETGVGEVKNGEGVQGLRRALVLAGSESQVMSLWPVSDAAGKEMMIEYYRALRRGEGRSEGLRQVQLRMLRSKKWEHPYYWAVFIESGAWTSLNTGAPSITQK